MKLRLEVVDGPEQGRQFELDGPASFLVGRSPHAHLRLDPAADRYVSRTHFLIELRPPRCVVSDLDSANGTYVNDERITRRELVDGDEIRAGRTRIRVGLVGMPARPSSSGELPLPVEEAPAEPAPLLDGRPPKEFACCGCGRDLAVHAAADGLARELADALYLCRACAAKQQMPSLAGRRLGDFTLLQPHGRGGMGVVYKAVHELTRRISAVKHLHPTAAEDERARKTFEREIDVQSAVVHPNLVRVLARGEATGCFFVAFEFLPGGDLGRLVGKVVGGPLPPALACRYTLQILAGLEALHAAGFVHRDLKPANVLLSRPWPDPAAVAKITDYGLAKSYEDAGRSIFDYTRAGEAGGSLLFMPPEQVLNFRFVTPAADVYAVGVTLYYLLTAHYTVDYPMPGEPMRPGARRRNPIELILEDPPVPVLWRTPDLPRGLAKVVDKAVQKDLDMRFATAAALRESLAEVVRHEGLDVDGTA
ncbi:MAG TPA: FHA domain-containing serine/threonine-protein kinase [Thermoanaerobaculaceae bacterium]|nr:FHA domain-containing serine/threonine-protein kinase [Thermoanaerobaculaceae bacterium]HRS15250.1 FHA domain-containing serine/threonine-protein kinase [Thermoanaerobaculaceae bacterium]